MEAHRVESGRLRDVGIVVVLIALHLGIVASVAFDERPVIWPLHNDTIHRVGRGGRFLRRLSRGDESSTGAGALLRKA